MIVATELDAGRGRKARRRRGKRRKGGTEAFELAPILLVLGILGASQVAHDQVEVDPRERASGVRRQIAELAPGKPRTVHAGVDLDGGVEDRLARRSRLRPLGDFVRRVQHGRQPVCDQGRRSAGHDPVENENPRIGQKRAQSDPLVHAGNKERVGAFSRKRFGDRRHADAVGIRLDHGRDQGTRGAASDLSVVRRKDSETHRQLR